MTTRTIADGEVPVIAAVHAAAMALYAAEKSSGIRFRAIQIAPEDFARLQAEVSPDDPAQALRVEIRTPNGSYLIEPRSAEEEPKAVLAHTIEETGD